MNSSQQEELLILQAVLFEVRKMKETKNHTQDVEGLGKLENEIAIL